MAWNAMRSEEEREALLLWIPSALPVFSFDALSHGYVDLMLRTLRWGTLTLIWHPNMAS